nr:unnamed protein product [Haemonchus contortus]
MEGVEEPDEDIAAEEAELAQKEVEDEDQHEDEVAEAEEAELAEQEGANEEEEHHENDVVVVVGALSNELAEEKIAEAEIKEFDEKEHGEPENEEAEEDILMREIDQEDDPNSLLEGGQEGQLVLIIGQEFRSTQQALHDLEEILR